ARPPASIATTVKRLDPAGSAESVPSQENGARIQDRTDSGDVGLITRSMYRNRAGRPRSCTSAPTLVTAAPAATSRVALRRASSPVASANTAAPADTPAMPPRNRYAGTSGTFHAGSFRI